ncbi:peptide chain release factor N(5)-glutamine methyltransferase [Lachnospiraceae bacterium MD1]|jgi:release factor glutamine methyltransferase|uniref:Release factor glutamine methyltransferase n=2 Tax=Variimorphobacter saccharofermentans TaxID=2755051 RepID=A0A839JXA8_9FIRM|nr:peptide chain release factor N(5)-glutamine methyltransferase [Variimorphobacter saccharofermentans]
MRVSMSSFRELRMIGQEILREQRIADADVDAWYLLAYVFGISRTEFLLREKECVPEEGKLRYLELIQKRAEHVPLQYITGSQEFMGMDFIVSSDVLIPRQDTELLVEEVLAVCKGKKVLDMCTGSGCIIISLAKLSKLIKATGADISDGALSIAKKNSIKLEAKVEFIKSDLFEQITERFDVIVSNPPYIPTKDIETLMPEVRKHEPTNALDGSEDGLLFYRRIAAEAASYLTKGGYLFLEIGFNQGNEVREILQKEGFTHIDIKKDLSGKDRIVSARSFH